MTRFSALNRVALAATLLLVGVASSLHAQTITTFDVPNSTGTIPRAINTRGEIVGSYDDLIPEGTHGFLRQRNGTIVTFDVKLHGHTWLNRVMDINASGRIIGYIEHPADYTNSFIRKPNGVVIIFPGRFPTGSAAVSQPDPEDVCPEGVAAYATNAVGEIAGSWGAHCFYGFLRQRDGTLIQFQVVPDGKHFTYTVPKAINAKGQITGFYNDSVENPSFYGFLRQPDGSFVTFAAPNSTTTKPKAINNSGQIAGHYEDANSVSHAFLREPAGTFITFDPPGSIDTQVTAINKKGVITGFYATADGMYHGFLRTRHGVLKSFDAPNAANEGTFPKDINDRGRIVGYYEDANFVLHGFVRKPW
jgi:uncharacterized membrane protein